MPIAVNIIRASDFVRVDADQRLNLEESKQMLLQLASACQRRGLDRAMLDMRDISVPDKPQFSDGELATLVRVFSAAGFLRHQRLAVLYRQDPHGGVRKFTFFSRMRGMQVQAFNEFEAAIQWLWTDVENREQKHGAEVPIHLRPHAQKRAAHLAGRIHRPALPPPVQRFKRSHA